MKQFLKKWQVSNAAEIISLTNIILRHLFLAHKYHSRHEFLGDIQQILENCILYNGKDSPFTLKAEQVVKMCRLTLDEVYF